VPARSSAALRKWRLHWQPPPCLEDKYHTTAQSRYVRWGWAPCRMHNPEHSDHQEGRALCAALLPARGAPWACGVPTNAAAVMKLTLGAGNGWAWAAWCTGRVSAHAHRFKVGGATWQS
jgi:hypothetical protein